MMHKIRSAAKPVYVVVIIAFIGTIIFAWGMDLTSKEKRPSSAVGMINNQEITMNMWHNAYENKYKELIQSNNDPSEEEIKALRDQTWNYIVGQTLLAQQIEKYNINVTSDELAEYVKNMPPQELYQAEEFQTEGKFDHTKYIDYLQNLASSTDPRAEQMLLIIESSIKSQVLLTKLQELVISTAYVSKPEVWEKYSDDNEKVKVNYIYIHERNIDTSGIEITEDQLLTRYKQDKDTDYKAEATATLKYASFVKEPSQADFDSVKIEIDEIYKKVTSGEDFAGLAEEYSQDRGGENGGDLGWFGKGRMVKPFEEAVFALEKSGDISEPVKSKFGWHIIKLTGKKKEKNNKGIEEEQLKASHILLKTEITDKTLTDLRDKAEHFRQDALEDDFSTATENYECEIESTNPFSPGKNISGIGPNPELSDFAFKAKEGSISKVVETRNAFIVATTGIQRPEGYTPFEEIKDRVRIKIHREIINDRAYAKGDSLYQLMQTENLNFKSMAIKFDLIVKETDYFARRDFVENVGSDPMFKGAAFSLTADNPISKPVQARSGCYIMKLVDKITVNKEKYTAIADSLYNESLNQKRRDTWNEWYRLISTNAEIKDYREDLFGS